MSPIKTRIIIYSVMSLFSDYAVNVNLLLYGKWRFKLCTTEVPSGLQLCGNGLAVCLVQCT
jgi:hypothetical protein